MFIRPINPSKSHSNKMFRQFFYVFELEIFVDDKNIDIPKH